MKQSTKEKIIALADSWYVRGCRLSEKTECLGWEAKARAGKFGKPEMDAHKAADMAFGKHFGIYEAIQIIEECEDIVNDKAEP